MPKVFITVLLLFCYRSQLSLMFNTYQWGQMECIINILFSFIIIIILRKFLLYEPSNVTVLDFPGDYKN